MKKIAIDWDETELRMVVGQTRGGNSVRVTDIAVIPLGEASDGDDIRSVLKRAISERGLESSEALVAIGRGMAELRELQLPPVPNDELPDMVRFQAIRSFASAGDSATVDFLVTDRKDSGIEMIAASIGPNKLNETRQICASAGLEIKRVSLRPLSASALYLTHRSSIQRGDVVLVDLLASDAEIVVARDGHVIFVRTVRVPTGEVPRSRALAGELKRSLFASGVEAGPQKVILWGRPSVHVLDQQTLAEACQAEVEIVNPFDMVDVDHLCQDKIPEHVGRLAPLVGLLVADERHSERLIDFLNPRKRPEEPPKTWRNIAMVAGPIAATLLIGYVTYAKFSALDRRIAELKTANAGMQASVDQMLASIDRTEKVDQFLDGGVQWLDEIRRLAEQMPASDQMIVRSLSATANVRSGGGALKVTGAAVAPEVIDEFERSLRDGVHEVVGDAVSEEKSQDAYRWVFTESIAVKPEFVRNRRYERILAEFQKQNEQEDESVSPSDVSSSSESANVETPDDSTNFDHGPTGSPDQPEVSDEGDEA